MKTTTPRTSNTPPLPRRTRRRGTIEAPTEAPKPRARSRRRPRRTVADRTRLRARHATLRTRRARRRRGVSGGGAVARAARRRGGGADAGVPRGAREGRGGELPRAEGEDEGGEGEGGGRPTRGLRDGIRRRTRGGSPTRNARRGTVDRSWPGKNRAILMIQTGDDDEQRARRLPAAADSLGVQRSRRRSILRAHRSCRLGDRASRDRRSARDIMSALSNATRVGRLYRRVSRPAPRARGRGDRVSFFAPSDERSRGGAPILSLNDLP